MMASVFISYTRKDEEKVAKIETLLNKKGVQTWRDNIAMPYAVNWDDAAIEALCRSSFAIIFDSQERQKKLENPDSAVQRELDWIKDLRLTYTVVDLDSADNLDLERVANDLINWMKAEYSENGFRIDGIRELVVGGYAYKNNTVSFSGNDVKGGIIRKAAKLIELRNIKDDLDSEPDFGTGPLQLRDSIYAYLKKYQIRVRNLLIMRISIIVSVILVAILGIRSGVALYNSVKSSTQISNLVEGKTVFSQTIDNDAVLGAAILNSDNLGSYYTKFDNYIKVLDAKYPVEYYSDVKSESLLNNLSKNSTDDYSIDLNSTDGIVNISINNKIMETFVIDGVPTDYDWSENASCVAVSSANKVFLHYIGDAYKPEELKGNYENIDKVYISNQKVYALTEKQSIVVWDISENKEKMFNYSVNEGQIVDKNGTVAAFIDDQKLIVNTGSNISELELPDEISYYASDISLSHDGKRIAILGANADGIFSVFEYNISAGVFKNIYTTNDSLRALDYSFDDSSVLFGNMTLCRLIRIELATGDIKQADCNGNSVYTLKSYNGGCVIGFDNAYMTIVDERMNISRSGSWTVNGSVPKQIAVSEETGSFYISSRNSNNSGCGKYFLSGAESLFFVNQPLDVTASNSAVAVSDDGKYVAFGNADGRINVWLINGMLPIWSSQNIKDGIISIDFSEDGKNLAVLGKSGTVYCIQLGSQITESGPDDIDAQLSDFRKQGRELYDRMSGLGLTDITLEEFNLEKHYGIKM